MKIAMQGTKPAFFLLIAFSLVAITFYRPGHLLSVPIFKPIDSNATCTALPIVVQQWQGPVVKHLVMFEFRSNATQAQIQNICHQMVTLKDRCFRPNTQEKYILSASGGRNNSREGLTNGLTHAFIMEFKNVEDRDYYVERDPFHRQFVNSLGPFVAGAQVLDFVPGVF